jgi:hypothetical protein
VDHGGEFVELAGAAEEVYVGEFFEDVFAVAFGHAADDADDQVGLGGLAVAEFAQAGPDLLLGVFANRAGVVNDDVGVFAVVGGLVALGAQLA